MSRAKSIKSILDGISTARLNFLERVEDSRLLEQRIQSVHDEVMRTYQEPEINNLQETYEVVAARRGLTPEDIKAVEDIVGRQAGGGAGEGGGEPNNDSEAVGGNGGDGGSPNEAADAGENGSGGESSGSEGGDPGSNGAAIRRTNGSIQVNISDPSNSLNGRGSTNATTVQ